METPKMGSIRKKKIKTLLTMMNKQNRRLIPIASPLIEMMHMTTTDEELDYLLQMGIGLYDYDHALKTAAMPKEKFGYFRLSQQAIQL